MNPNNNQINPNIPVQPNVQSSTPNQPIPPMYMPPAYVPPTYVPPTYTEPKTDEILRKTTNVVATVGLVAGLIATIKGLLKK